LVLAIQSFPMGFNIKSLADDVDPLVVEETEPVGFEMLHDGSLFSYDKAAPIKVSITVIPGSDEDINCKILLQSKKGSVKLIPLSDSTSMVITYPDGGRVILSGGTIVRGQMADSIMMTGRKKGNTYTFVFGSFAGAQSAGQLVASVAQNVLSLL
jgi:hypothetical protein